MSLAVNYLSLVVEYVWEKSDCDRGYLMIIVIPCFQDILLNNFRQMRLNFENYLRDASYFSMYFRHSNNIQAAKASLRNAPMGIHKKLKPQLLLVNVTLNFGSKKNFYVFITINCYILNIWQSSAYASVKYCALFRSRAFLYSNDFLYSTVNVAEHWKELKWMETLARNWLAQQFCVTWGLEPTVHSKISAKSWLTL